MTFSVRDDSSCTPKKMVTAPSLPEIRRCLIFEWSCVESGLMILMGPFHLRIYSMIPWFSLLWDCYFLGNLKAFILQDHVWSMPAILSLVHWRNCSGYAVHGVQYSYAARCQRCSVLPQLFCPVKSCGEKNNVTTNSGVVLSFRWLERV